MGRRRRSRPGGRAPAVALVVALGLAACTDPGGGDTGSDAPGRADASSAAGDDAGGAGAPEGGTPGAAQRSGTPSGQPLVLAVHATRPPVRVDEAQARDVVQGGVEGWGALGQEDAPLRVVDGTDAGTRTPAAALRAVRHDRGTLALVPAAAVDARVSAARVGGVDPLRRPGAYPLTVPGPAPPRPVTVTVTGDVMLGRGVEEAAAATGDLSAPLRPTAERLASADVTVVNLESTLSRAGAPRQGSDSFAADPAVLDGLTDAGVDVVGLANNHTGDFGPRALVRTVRRVSGAGLTPVGAGAEAAQAREPAVVERHGVRVGVLAFNAIGETPRVAPGRPGAVSVRMPPRTGPLNRRDLRRMTRAVRRLDARADAVVVLPHWGTQYTHRPEPVQRDVARALADAGADLVVGGHPHWVQGVAWRDGTYVAHSLGNFVFDMDFSRQTQEGVVAEAVLWGGDVKAVRLVPVVQGDGFTPRVVRGARAAAVLDGVWATSRGAAFDPDGD